MLVRSVSLDTDLESVPFVDRPNSVDYNAWMHRISILDIKGPDGMQMELENIIFGSPNPVPVAKWCSQELGVDQMRGMQHTGYEDRKLLSVRTGWGNPTRREQDAANRRRNREDQEMSRMLTSIPEKKEMVQNESGSMWGSLNQPIDQESDLEEDSHSVSGSECSAESSNKSDVVLTKAIGYAQGVDPVYGTKCHLCGQEWDQGISVHGYCQGCLVNTRLDVTLPVSQAFQKIQSKVLADWQEGRPPTEELLKARDAPDGQVNSVKFEPYFDYDKLSGRGSEPDETMSLIDRAEIAAVIAESYR